MNRYVTAGLLDDMRRGKRVLYLAANRVHARRAFDDLVWRLAVGERARRTNGAERIDSWSGGCIKFSSVGSSLRGVAVDVVVLDGEPTLRQSEELAVLVEAAELVRA